MAAVLLTGFQATSWIDPNPAAELMQMIDAERQAFAPAIVHPIILPVDFEAAPRELAAAVDCHAPEAIISFGVSCSRDMICVERVGLNLDDSSSPDNAGVRRQGSRIVEDGPVGYWSTLDVDRTVAALQAGDLRAVASGYAGGHLCNHTLYTTLRLLATTQRSHIRAGFVHVPPAPDQLQPDWPIFEGMTTRQLFEAAQIIVACCDLSAGPTG